MVRLCRTSNTKIKTLNFYFPRKYEALSSIPNTSKKKKKEDS
jgi:hypothetical protein